MKITKNNQFGRSMIEMLGVLAIIGVLSIGGIAGYSKAMEKHKLNKAINSISSIAQNLRMNFFREKNRAFICNNVSVSECNVFKKLNIISDFGVKNNRFILQSDTLSHPNIQLVGIAFLNNYPDIHSMSSVDIEVDNEETCLSLLTADWSNSGLVSIDNYSVSGDDPDFFFRGPEWLEIYSNAGSDSSYIPLPVSIKSDSAGLFCKGDRHLSFAFF